jgi:hypothetical protein
MSLELSEIPEQFKKGYHVEHILLSVTVIHINEIIQYNDSCAQILERELPNYKGVIRVKASVYYDHSQTRVHSHGCECGICKSPSTDAPPT